MKNTIKRVISLLLVLLLVISSMLLLSSCTKKESADQGDNSNSAYVSINEEVPDTKITDEESALKAIASVAESLGISDADKELKVEKVNEFEKETFYRMQQYHNGIPVYGNEVILSVNDKGIANTVTSNVSQITETVDTDATVSQEKVKDNISKYLLEELQESGDFYCEIPDLEKCQQYIYETEAGEFVLSYLVKTGFVDFFVDAKTGDVLDYIYNIYENKTAVCYNGDRSEQFDGYFSETEGEYYAFNTERNMAVFTYKKVSSKSNKAMREYLTSKDDCFGNDSDANEVKDEYGKGVTFINNVSDIYDYYYDTFGEKAYGQFILCYNDGYSWGKNALGGTVTTDDGENFGYMSMGHKTGVTDIDVMAHEYTHIVSKSIVGWSGKKQNGAVNEGYSDLFGEIIESKINGSSPDWIMKGDNIGVKRNIASPSSTKYPEKVTDWNRSGEDYSHAYSTVISHAAYLMWNGIDGNESMKIDIDSLAKIWYRALLLMHSDADFEQCANKVLQSAKTLQGLTDDQKDCVKKAFERVGIGAVADSSGSVYRGSKLNVLDTNFDKYGNYHLQIYSIEDLRDPKSVLEADITDANGYPLDLEEGSYIIRVKDNDENGSKNEYSKTLKIIDGGIRKYNAPITIYTDFGGIVAEDFTIPAEEVVTLGELSVIEPEIVPADATSYSIKWSSSNEDVATVSPSGEAGIITTLSKGTATITAELTAGGKTITKSTELKVASKARDTVLVLDISGSMYGEPLDEMKKSAVQFCNDLLKDEYNNRVGIVFYDDGISTIDLTDDLDMLISRIQAVDDGGRTNMEAALSAADDMLKYNGKSDAIKNVVIMADGIPNEGATSYSDSMPSGSYYSYYSSVKYANAVIDKAKTMMNDYNLYSLGFFHSLTGESKDFATALMKELTNQTDGYYQVDKAEDLQFAFGDISEEINLGSKIVINIACPVDVRVSYGGEMLSSSSADFRNVASFGTLQMLGKDKDIKVVSLDSDKDYDIELIGTGVGKMDYSVNYLDEKERLADYRSFEAVPITMTTVITSNTDNTSKDIELNIDEDGDGIIDVIWTALAKSTGKITYEKEPETEPVTEPATAIPEEPDKDGMPVWTIILICVAAFVVLGGGLAVVTVCARRKGNDEEEEEKAVDDEDIFTPWIICPKCGKVYPADTVCDCAEEETNHDRITEDAERNTGFIQITNGSMNGFTVPIKDGETLYLGKDPRFANIVFSKDYMHVSRLHCAITYDAKVNRYYVIDSSSNGTFLIGNKRLVKGKRTPVDVNTVLILANENCTVWLQ